MKVPLLNFEGFPGPGVLVPLLHHVSEMPLTFQKQKVGVEGE